MEILGEELLSLPELVKESSRQITENSKQIFHLGESLDQLTVRVDQLVKVVESHDKRLQRLENQVGEIDGSQLEENVAKYPRQYLRRMHMTGLRTISEDERDEILEALDEEDQIELDRVDVMLIGNRRGVDQKQAYIAVEASATAEDHDLERALKRALLLAKAVKAPTLPLVVTRRKPSPSIVKKAEDMGVALSSKHDGLVQEAPWIT